MLTSKQRAYLRSISANDETILMIGKNEVSSEIVKQADDALAARELIKCKVLDTHQGCVKDVANQIAENTDSEIVCVIGSKFVLFRQKSKDSKFKLPRAK